MIRKTLICRTGKQFISIRGGAGGKARRQQEARAGYTVKAGSSLSRNQTLMSSGHTEEQN